MANQDVERIFPDQSLSRSEIELEGKKLYDLTRSTLMQTPDFLRSAAAVMFDDFGDSLWEMRFLNKGKNYEAAIVNDKGYHGRSIELDEISEDGKRIKGIKVTVDFDGQKGTWLEYHEEKKDITSYNSYSAKQKVEEFITSFTGHF